MQQALAKAILADPDVESLSSFIGVDGSNVTLNSGRFLINLKPHRERKATRERDHPPPAAGDRRASPASRSSCSRCRTCRSTPRSARRNISSPSRTRIWRRCRHGRRRCSSGSRKIPVDRRRRERSAAERALGHRRSSTARSAARFGITPAIVDNALYDAYGQRIISTIFTQTNQYRVILDIDPKMTRSLDSLNSLYLPSSASTSGQMPLNSVANFDGQAVAAADLASEAVSGDDDFVQPRAGRLARRRGRRDQRGARPTSTCRRASPSASRARRRPSSPRCRTRCSCSRRRSLTMYIVLGVLYESFIHPITILSTLPSAGIGALLALERRRAPASTSSASSASCC